MEQKDTIFDPRPPWGAAELREGEVVGERYRVLGRIAMGSASVVYRVVHEALEKELALKVLRPELSSSAEFIARFEDEARFASELENVHVVRVSDFGRTAANVPFVVMDLVEGSTLFEWQSANKDAPHGEIVDIFDQLLAGLEYAHGKGVVHGNLAPESAIVSSRAAKHTVKILDLGMSRLLHGARAEDPDVDLRAVGALLRQTIAGRTDSSEAHRAVTGEIAAIAARLEGEGGRFANAAEVRDALRRCLPIDQDATIPNRPQGLGHRIRLIAAALAVISIVGVAVWTLSERRVHEQPSVEREEDPSTAIEKALSQHDLPRARELTIRALTDKPDDARANLLAGHLAFLENDRANAASSYARAAALDPAIAADATFAADAKEILLDSAQGAKNARTLIDVLAKKGDEHAVPLLAAIVENGPTPGTRQRGYQGLERLGETKRIDRVAYLVRDLERIQKTERECVRRKWYVEKLIATHDAHALPALEKQRPKPSGGWVFDTESKVSACMSRELEQGIKALRSGK